MTDHIRLLEVCKMFGLTRQEGVTFLNLEKHKGEECPRDLIHADLSGARVVIHKLRKKLKPFGLEILMLTGGDKRRNKGYTLRPIVIPNT